MENITAILNLICLLYILTIIYRDVKQWMRSLNKTKSYSFHELKMFMFEQADENGIDQLVMNKILINLHNVFFKQK